MPTTTTNYSFNKPVVGGDEDAWGGYINGNWDTLDTLLGGVTNAELSILDGATITTTELNYNDITTLGTVEASKVVTADASGDVTFPDGEKLKLGTSGDLEVYHDGSNSNIKDVGTGFLSLDTNGSDIRLTSDGQSKTMGYFAKDGAVYLYHNGNQKISTTTVGADITGTLTTDGVTVDGTLDIEEVFEKVATTTSTGGAFSFNCLDQGVLFFTNNQSSNATVNFRGDSSTTLNSVLAIGQSITSSILMTQGSTAYYLNAYQVDGSAVTPKWANGSAPSAGNASGIDVYSFTIIKTADATFTVLASQTQYA